MTDERTYLELSGAVMESGEYVTLESGLTAESPRQPYVDEDWVLRARVDLLAKRGKVLASFTVPVVPVCAHPALGASSTGDGLPHLLVAHVPFDPDARLVQVVLDGEVVHELAVAAAPPVVAVDWKEPGMDPHGFHEVTWTAENEDPKLLRHRLVWRVGDDDRVLTPWLEGSSTAVDLDALPSGPGELVLSTTDGVHVVDSPPLPLDVPRRPCRATIVAPADGDKVPSGRAVELWGTGFYEDGPEPKATGPLAWSSSLDGALVEGARATVVLSNGVHELTLTAGTGERTGTASVCLSVG